MKEAEADDEDDRQQRMKVAASHATGEEAAVAGHKQSARAFVWSRARRGRQ